MDYEKKYKEALARMELCVRTGLKITPEYIFTELAESKDEKIRKEMIDFIRETIEYVGESPNIWTMNNAKEWLAWLEKQGEPQPYRGNADTMRKNLIKAFKSVGSNHWGGLGVRDILYFLESKDAIELEKQSGQNPAKWSDDDEEELYLTISLLDAFKEKAYTNDCENCINWLKSLKPQPHWKPTEEQMKGV